MEMLKDPSLKENDVFSAFAGYVIVQVLIYTAFAYSVPFLILAFQILISFVLICALVPIKTDKKYIKHRVRWEQRWFYSPSTVLFYGLMSGDWLFFGMYLVGMMGVGWKYDVATAELDADYSEKVFLEKKRIKKNIENIWTTY